MSNLAENLVRTAARYPEGVAIRMDEVTLTWAQLDTATARVANYLRAQGIQQGDRVVLSLPNIPQFAVIAYGVLRAGGILIPMNPMFMPREVIYYLTDSGASIIFGMSGQTEKSAAEVGVHFEDGTKVDALVSAYSPEFPVVSREMNDTAVILYTSGTTGRPKGAELTHGSLDTNQEITARTLIEVGPDDVIVGCLPLFHIFGLTCALNTSISTGATLTLIPRFDPAKALDVIERDRASVFEGVPTMYQAMLNAAEGKDVDLGSLRVAVSGGSALPVEVLHRFEERFGANILEGYGLSETSPVASFNLPHDVRKPGSIGKPVEGVEMMVVSMDGEPLPVGEIGELVIRGHLLMKGYWRKPEATAQAIRDGWFYSGDLARQDDEGYFYIVDRAKDIIVRGGYNVYPREVEEVLYEHPEIAEVAVVGIPDAHYGEEIAAFVVRRPGSALDAGEIQRFTKERLAAYKYPRRIEFIENLPKGATGKILKRELRSPIG